MHFFKYSFCCVFIIPTNIIVIYQKINKFKNLKRIVLAVLERNGLWEKWKYYFDNNKHYPKNRVTAHIGWETLVWHLHGGMELLTVVVVIIWYYYHIICIYLNYCAHQLFSYSNIGTVNTVSGVISPTNLSLLSNPGGSPSSSSGGGGGGSRSRGHSQTTLPRWNTQCQSGQPFITLDEDYMMTPLMSGNGGQGNGGTLIDDGKSLSFECIVWYTLVLI